MDTITLKRIPATKNGALPYHLPFGCEAQNGLKKVCFLDVETTGVDPETDEVIEVGLCIAKVHNDKVVSIDEAHSFLREPSKPISEEITRITGITNEQVKGAKPDYELITEIISSADFIVAHNAGFDRKFIDKLLPELSGMEWTCSMTEYDWRAAGYETKALRYLVMEHGYFFDGHRASVDAIATAWLMYCNFEAAKAVFGAVDREDYTLRVLGNSFSIKDELKQMGFSFSDDSQFGKHWFSGGLSFNECEELETWIRTQMGHRGGFHVDKVNSSNRYK